MALQKGMLSGHIFSAYLACPQRAWLEIHGDKKKRLFSPIFLRGMQRDGLRHEREVEETFFPTGERLDDGLSIDDRLRKTEELLRKGTSVVLQGAVTGADGVGVVDVLEYVEPAPGSRFGHRYRVGEVKHTAALQTGHIFQALWYRDLLLEWSGTAADDVFFIAGDLVRREIRAEVHEDAFQRVLGALRAMLSSNAPAEHLCSHCPTCTWRGVCLPALVKRHDLSLMPRLGRRDCDRLSSEGFSNWEAVDKDLHRAVAVLELDAYGGECLRVALERLRGLGAVTREVLDWAWIAGLQPMAVDIVLLEAGMPAPDVFPTSLWTADEGRVPTSTASTDRLAKLLCRESTVVYGEADLAGLQNLARQRDIRMKREPTVLSRLVQRFVHEPLLGFELSCVWAHAQGHPDPEEREMEPAKRVEALGNVRDWIAGRAG